MEAINKYYLEDGHIEPVENYTIDTDEKGRIIYEVIRVIDGVPLFFEGHIRRMEYSFRLMNKTFSYKFEKIKEYLTKLIKVNEIINGNIKLTFDVKTDTMKVFTIKHSYPSEDLYNTGIKTIFYHGERNNPNAKVVDSSFRSKVIEEMKKSNAYEAILVNNNGYITEGSKSNIFLIKDNNLFTPPIEAVLPGITRGQIISVAKSIGINAQEAEVRFEELKDFDAAFISGTSPKILPISNVNDIKLNVENELMRRLMKEFDREIELYVKKNKE